MHIKICGNRRADDVRAAIAGGADAVGVIVGARYLSEDAVSADSAARLLARVPRTLTTVLVTHRQSAAEILAIHADVPAHAIQLHDTVAPGELVILRRALPAVRMVAAVHVSGDDALETARRAAPRVDALLLDSRTDDRIGGTGRTHDWSISATIVRAVDRPVILAGGLTPENVTEAIATVRPHAVDVNSGVDDPDGNTNADAVRSFVQVAHEAGGVPTGAFVRASG